MAIHDSICEVWTAWFLVTYLVYLAFVFWYLWQFTVTRVDDTAQNSNSVPTADSNDNDINKAAVPNHSGANSTVSPGEHEMVSLQISDMHPSMSDGESAYGDTLTQTSITKLLSKKFKVGRQLWNKVIHLPVQAAQHAAMWGALLCQ